MIIHFLVQEHVFDKTFVVVGISDAVFMTLVVDPLGPLEIGDLIIPAIGVF